MPTPPKRPAKPPKRTPAEKQAIMRALALSAAGSPDGRPVYHAVSRDTGTDRTVLRRWWNELEPRDREALRNSAAQAPKPAPAPEPTAEPEGLRARLAQRMGRKPDDPAVDIAVDLHMERDRTVSDGPRAAATKELARFLAQHLTAGGRAGPETPDEFIARCRECEELVIEAVLDMPGLLTDPRVVEAVREANHEAAEGR